MTVHRDRLSSFSAHASILMITACMMGSQCLQARSVEPDIPRLQSGAEHGSIAEEIALGAAYFAGRGVSKDLKQAAYWYEKAANSGDPHAQIEIGYFYQAGIGVERNPERAVRWYERAAASGLIRAKVNLGVAYVWGVGVRKDPQLAAQLFREAAKKGDGSGACYLGDMYYFGLGIAKDTNEAQHWFEVGSKLHNPMAEFDLAMILLSREDRTKEKEALALLRESATSGYVRAKHQLGLMLVRDPGLEKAPGEAVATLNESAAEGFWKSSVVLGVLARDGRSGMSKDSKMAYFHFAIAAIQGGDTARQMVANDLQLLQSQLARSEMQSLDSEAVSWTNTHKLALQFTEMQGKDSQRFPAVAMEYPNADSHAGMLFGAPITEELQ
jgi:TPR repeat protein